MQLSADFLVGPRPKVHDENTGEEPVTAGVSGEDPELVHGCESPFHRGLQRKVEGTEERGSPGEHGPVEGKHGERLEKAVPGLLVMGARRGEQPDAGAHADRKGRVPVGLGKALRIPSLSRKGLAPQTFHKINVSEELAHGGGEEKPRFRW